MSELDAWVRRLGHRNWIAVVDMAFPLLGKEGVSFLEGWTRKDVLGALERAPHVRPEVYLDSEMSYLDDSNCPGPELERSGILEEIKGLPTTYLEHEEIIRMLNAAASEGFAVLVIKTQSLIPYTSVFLRLECGYWSQENETELRSKMVQQ